jgi:hypothetical protein
MDGVHVSAAQHSSGTRSSPSRPAAATAAAALCAVAPPCVRRGTHSRTHAAVLCCRDCRAGGVGPDAGHHPHAVCCVWGRGQDCHV